MEIAAGLWWVPTTISNAYLWRDGQGRTHVVDPGMPGDHDVVLAAVAAAGLSLNATSSIIVTHWHRDHSGAAAALAAATGATVWAGRADADVLMGRREPEYPDLTDGERPIFEEIVKARPESMQPCRCDSVRSYDDGAVIDEGKRAVILDVAGHTAGSIAIHFADLDTVITGDVAINDPETGLRHGPFNADLARARQRYDQLLALGCRTIAVGHGEPVSHI